MRVTVVCALLSAVSLALSLTGTFSGVLPADIAWVAIVLCGFPILLGAARGVILEHDIKADLLVALALVASVGIREYFAAGEVALIMQIGSLLEDYTSEKARRGIEKLIGLKPRTARVRRDGSDVILPADEVRAGDVLTVFAGEMIPADGTILEGRTSIDQSVMTGESIPVDKKEGDTVTSGTTNRFGTFSMRADRACGDSLLQRMIRLAEEADANKAPIVSLADRWATWLVAAALLCALLIWLFTGEFVRAVTALVVFCPCAFILATPTAVVAGIGNAARYGILIRSGDALERLSRVRRIAFDKTGTLTRGRPQVTAFRSLDASFTDDDILRLAARVERYSGHPLGKAVVASFQERTGEDPEPVSDSHTIAGRAVSGRIGGTEVAVGKADYFASLGMPLNGAVEAADEYLGQGATVVCLSHGGRVVGLIALADTIRPEAGDTVRALESAGISCMLLTGDNERAARSAASAAGIADVRSDLLPEEKASVVKEYEDRGEPTCMIGDGVNDALALSSAYAGIAMGGIGSDIAVESADAVLVSDEIKRLPYLFRLMGKVMRKVRTNIIASLLINVSAVALSAAGALTPVTGALWHNFGSVFVVVNAALLLREKD
ncbi:cation-translocating P-type ATPase [uncultured Fretibacterium sp.]|uniref:heavy metal translocating P-type ATPase n=1 Tax=uncultured Fretibacterium sp. TaxID=1678694 RepID=UPI002616B4A4|nr:cation-translocating P-type ATPase [uncultured Fretibacterium sp.]